MSGPAIGMRVEGGGNKVIIIAPDDQGLQKVCGIAAIRRLVLLSRQLGFEEVHVFGDVATCAPVISDLVPPRGFHKAEGPAALGQALGGISFGAQEMALVLRGNYVLDRQTLSAFIRQAPGPGLFRMETGNRRDCASIYLSTSEHILSVMNALWSAVPKGGVPQGAVSIAAADGLPYRLNGDENARRTAEDILFARLADSTRQSDGFLAKHISRKISQRMSRKLVLTGITPNQVTLICAAIGLIGAVFFALGGYLFPVLGAALFVVCVIVDGVDGEIARLKLQESEFGHKLDIILDNVVHFAIFVGDRPGSSPGRLR